MGATVPGFVLSRDGHHRLDITRPPQISPNRLGSRLDDRSIASLFLLLTFFDYETG